MSGHSWFNSKQLPPVGTVCKHNFKTAQYGDQWSIVTIINHDTVKDILYAVYRCESCLAKHFSESDPGKFKPLTEYVYLQREHGKFSYESQLVYRHCVMEKIPTRYFSLDDPDLTFENAQLVVGSVEAMNTAFNRLGIQPPTPAYYPNYLKPYFHREIWSGTVKDVMAKLIFGHSVFAKSKEWKKITGQVFDHTTGFSVLNENEKSLEMYLSDCVNFVSEYRVYVQGDEIKTVCHYWGDDIEYDCSVVEQIADLLYRNNPTLKAYVFDIGVLSTGETALVEVNDAWAIGAYSGIDAKQYYNLLQIRWNSINESLRV